MLTELITSIEHLIAVHGLDAVRDAVEFTGRHSNVNRIQLSVNGLEYFISRAQQNEIAVLARAGDKIQAIKRFREFTSCGLKEAKDVIESRTW